MRFSQLPWIVVLCWAPSGLVVGSDPDPDQAPAVAPAPSVLAQALAGPLQSIEGIVFAARLPYDDPHWYANIGYFCDDEHKKAYAGNGKPDIGKLCLLDVRSRQVQTLFENPGGSVRDPEVHYDAQKVLFSHRPAGTDHYHLCEINLDGTGYRQLTSGPFDDYEPAYLPDGGIVFVSTRCQCWVNCWMTQVGVLYRCDADGGNIQRLSHNPEHDNTPSVLPDGRILYTRWEYVDRSQVEFHHLWTISPDGSGEMAYYGNMHPGIVMIDARPIPNSRQVLVNFSPGHGVTDHQGHVAIVSPAEGPDSLPMARQLTNNWPLFKDPYPLAADCFLVAQENRILVMDGSGRTELLHEEPLPGLVHEARPVLVRSRERVIAPRIRPEQPTGRLVLADVYRGRNMEGVARGEVKKLLVLELLPKQVNFSGGPDLVSWLGTFALERVLGTVPVEPDGSACFEVPACRPVFFVALDQHDRSVQRMHSFVSVMPGETTSCIGCHEPRSQSPEPVTEPLLLALQRPPSVIEPFDGQPDVVDFPRDIQPILDQHCVACHHYQQRDGGVLLTGDLGPQWSHSYFHLFAHLQVGDGRNGLGNYPPRSIGSSASPLLDKLEPSHYEVRVSPDQWRTVWLWIESGAPYAGSYAGLRNAEEQALDSRAAARVFRDGVDVFQQRCAACHALGQMQNETGRPIPFNPNVANNARGLSRRIGVHERVVLENDPLTKFSWNILVNMTRPQYSPLLLGPLARSAGGWESCGAVFADAQDPGYRRLLEAIERGKEEADVRPRYGTPAFRPNRQYIRELKRYGVLAADFDPHASPIDVFEADQRYWRSFWYTPADQ
jgi:hypothetical protein